jgi:hypothetical protein
MTDFLNTADGAQYLSNYLLLVVTLYFDGLL